MATNPETGLLPDLLQPGLAVIFCGTAAGTRSAALGHYYANPSNRFWETLHTTGLTPTQLVPEEDRDVLQYGIGLTDLVKTEAGMDRKIAGLSQSAALAARLQDILRTYAPVRLAFSNGKSTGAASRALGVKVSWGRQPILPAFPDTQIWVLPSTSSANNRHFSRLRHHWTALAEDIRRSA